MDCQRRKSPYPPSQTKLTNRQNPNPLLPLHHRLLLLGHNQLHLLLEQVQLLPLLPPCPEVLDLPVCLQGHRPPVWDSPKCPMGVSNAKSHLSQRVLLPPAQPLLLEVLAVHPVLLPDHLNHLDRVLMIYFRGLLLNDLHPLLGRA